MPHHRFVNLFSRLRRAATATLGAALTLAVKEFPNGRIKSFIWALGEDADGELYVLANGMNSAFGTRGKVFKLGPQ